ncbi:hypothetical protein JCM8208_002150 [Rhodotorula glutinis]
MSPMPLPRALVLGAHRHGGLLLVPQLSSRVEVVGLSDAIHPFDPRALACTLRAFHPPVQVLSLGGAFSDDDAARAREVWDEYRREVEREKGRYGEESGAGTACVRTTGGDITAVKAASGGEVEGYEAVGRAVVANLDKALAGGA